MNRALASTTRRPPEPGGTTDETVDVVVVGFGGAGACAAISAAEAGAEVLVLDRFYGGGATEQSGGVIYAGGGTAQQSAAGTTDSPAAMEAYLRHEVAGVVSDETLRRFCESSREMVTWLEAHGLEFEGSLCPYKTSYPTNRHYLYYSGNELVPAYRDDTHGPAPRGHRMKAKNFTGREFFARLRAAAERAGVRTRPLAEVTGLVVENGAVVGVEYRKSREPGRWHRELAEIATKMRMYHPPTGRALHRLAARTARAETSARRVRARRGVLLTSGGYGYDQQTMDEHAPAWKGISVAGTAGDDGAALWLGAQVGAATDRLNKISGWRFIAPPSGFLRGIVVDGQGRRFASEQLYGATLTEPFVEEHGGQGHLIVDQATWLLARSQVRSQSAVFHAPQLAWMFGPTGHVRAESIDELARAIGVDADSLGETVAEHDRRISAGEPDEWGKSDDVRTRLGTGPFYAVDLSPEVSRFYPIAFITLGGLVVEERTGQVRSTSGALIPGLYAGGRAAVGLCSNSYVSGLSLADAVFSGRRAGESAAAGGAETGHLAATTSREST
jgi:3-oxo-5alpha-steroid 4-dehydrogenase